MQQIIHDLYEPILLRVAALSVAISLIMLAWTLDSTVACVVCLLYIFVKRLFSCSRQRNSICTQFVKSLRAPSYRLYHYRLWVACRRLSVVRLTEEGKFLESSFKIANITFRTLHSSQLVYLRSVLHTHHSTRSLRLSNTNLLSAPFVRTSFGARSFSVAAPKIWNSLPPALRMCTSHDTFRHQLKTRYFQQAFQPT